MWLDSLMKARDAMRCLVMNERLNFLLTNRVPRIALTRLMGRVSRIEHPRFARLAIRVWTLFTDLDLSDAARTDFRSLHACFTRELKPGARMIDPRGDVLASPCDAIVGSAGAVVEGQAYQAKGFPYRADELFGSASGAACFEGGRYVTLRLTSAMYHRFHAPCDATVEHVTYISGDTWNVNPIALARVERLFCRNERAVIRLRTDHGEAMALVPVAAILVASMRLRFLDVLLHLRYLGPNEIPCQVRVKKGDQLGWFEHGSTIVAFVPHGFELADGVVTGARIRMGQPLLVRQASAPVINSSPTSHERAIRRGEHAGHEARPDLACLAVAAPGKPAGAPGRC